VSTAKKISKERKTVNGCTFLSSNNTAEFPFKKEKKRRESGKNKKNYFFKVC